MSTDRAQHVLDAIDGALEDWSVSGDAMRWTPEPKRPAPRLIGGPAVIYTAPVGTSSNDVHDWMLVADREQIERLWQQIGEAVRPMIGAVERAAEAMGMSVRQFADHLAAMRPLAEPPRLKPEDPKERALRLRQQRHTGPDRDVVKQRRPRLHR